MARLAEALAPNTRARSKAVLNGRVECRSRYRVSGWAGQTAGYEGPIGCYLANQPILRGEKKGLDEASPK